MKIKEEKFWYWIVKHLPNKIKYFCFMHIMIETTTGKYSDTIVPLLTGTEAAKRYANDHGI